MPHSTDAAADRAPLTFGQRVRRARERNGQTRAVVGGLVGRSMEWVKAIETGRLGVPRLPLLLRLANVLQVDDLSDLVGEDNRLSTASFVKSAHNGLPAVREALTTYRFRSVDEEPESVDVLLPRVRSTWDLWHAAGKHRTRVSAVLPDLLDELQHAARTLEGNDRRRALIALAETYHLAQLYLSFQPAPELVMLTGDRSMAAAQDADSPKAIAAAAWYMNHVFRDAGERHEARVDLAMKAADLLRPDEDPEDLARWGLLHLAAALSFAKVGRRGDAERFWDRADDAARRLGDGYTHPYLIFGRGMVDAYAITMYADLVKGSRAVEAAGRVDLAPMPSATRRSFHLVEMARAYSTQGEHLTVMHLLRRAFEASEETVRFNIFARSAVAELAEASTPLVREDAEDLSRRLRLPAVA
ncbi:helix-turn-helix transcriptional regulator [Streptomyces sp. B6B3]|uniref:helix-turn-helix domain-containing protein n=1 Tax=Streptomyces sp. B6B3 TaxID=3153570 RepID=UPI00325EC8D3